MMEWRMVEGLLSTLLTLTQAYFTCGSSREAEYFAQQAPDLAESANAPTMAVRALMRKGEIQLCRRQLDAGRDSSFKAAELLQNLPYATIQSSIEQLQALPASKDTKGDENVLLGKLALHSVYEQFRSDMFLSSLAEYTIARPIGMTSDRAVSVAPSTQNILNDLSHAEGFL
ncbi:hypothetical protein AZE42_11142 [Rhizopogon vesiculosus]|uniref:Uncharacterized protein n=1 Tax=Rhizopogon vesiculosus TaxID=180088 RepID=A0A1J8PLR4_9AGAM|nr:hypothetical protein AZE42_11142 [Rhizopogon vesiculosus]